MIVPNGHYVGLLLLRRKLGYFVAPGGFFIASIDRIYI